MNTARVTTIALAGLVLSLIPAALALADDAPASAPARQEWTAIRVPDGTIQIDGRDGDWQRAGDALKRSEFSPDTAKNWSIPDINRGQYGGKDDCSITLHFAHDKDNLYVLADVRDQFLVNTADNAAPNNGDDLELFIDASDPADRFGEKYNENVRQYIFVPAYANPKWTKPFIWQGDKRPAKKASRLRPWGYTMEIAIPKASFPHWKDHPEMDSVAFEGFIADTDSPGVDGHHPSPKGALFFGKFHWHAMTQKEFGVLKLEKEPVNLRAPTQEPTTDTKKATIEKIIKDAETIAGGPVYIPGAAQAILDAMGGENAARLAQIPRDHYSSDTAKAALFVSAQRPDLKVSTDRILQVIKLEAAESDMASVAMAQYGLMALARRQKMPLVEMRDVCVKNGDPSLLLTYAWCCGINGDKKATPILADLLKNDNIRIRMMAILSMGELGDKAAIEPLKTMLTGPRISHNDVRLQAEDSLRKLGVPIEPLPPRK